jgi:hypothetical protein
MTPEKLKNLTTQPGVYQMLDKQGMVIYVGKAKNYDFNTPSAAALSIFENTLSSIQDLRTQQKATLENIKGLIKEKLL